MLGNCRNEYFSYSHFSVLKLMILTVNDRFSVFHSLPTCWILWCGCPPSPSVPSSWRLSYCLLALTVLIDIEVKVFYDILVFFLFVLFNKHFCCLVGCERFFFFFFFFLNFSLIQKKICEKEEE